MSLNPPWTRRGTERLMELCASHEFRLLCWRPPGPNPRYTLACFLHLMYRIPSPCAWAQTKFSASSFLFVQYLMPFIKLQVSPAHQLLTWHHAFAFHSYPKVSAYRSFTPTPLAWNCCGLGFKQLSAIVSFNNVFPYLGPESTFFFFSPWQLPWQVIFMIWALEGKIWKGSSLNT